MFLSVMACQLGLESLDVSDLVRRKDPDSLKRLPKTGFETVYRQEKNAPAERLALEAKLKIEDFDPSAIDAMVVVSTLFEDSPSWAQGVASALGLSPSADIIRIQEACTGYVTALNLADGLLKAGSLQEVLIVTFDNYSTYMTGSISLQMLFSDSLTMTIVSKDFPKSHVPNCLLELSLKGQMAVNKRGSESDLNVSNGKLEMNGAAVFQFAIESVPSLVEEVLREIAVHSSEVSWFLHQGSRFVVDQLTHALGLESTAHFRSASYGNTVSGSIPFQLIEHHPKDRYLGLVGFGMGLSAKVAVYKIGEN